MTVAIAAAGTGGHVVPALTIASALESLGLPRDRILFLGGDRFEATAVPERGYRFVGFELTKLRRSFSVDNLKIPVVVRRASAAMAEEIRSVGCDVVLAMSGYVTVPAALAARRAGVPLIVHEQNAQAALAARFGARRARVTLLGLPGPAQRLPRSELVGNPLRPEIVSFSRRVLRSEARLRYGLPEEGPVVGVLGGSLGAQVLNEAVPSIVDRGVASVLHLTGPEAHGVVSRPHGPSSLPWVRVPYEHEMEHFYAAADLVVARAGAMTVSELAATRTPSILVPLERVGQMHNAAVLADADGATIVRQRDVATLPDLVGAIVPDERRMAAMARAAQTTARTDATTRVATRVLEVAGD